MRIPWWHSIRWRLALGSMLVALLATLFLAVITIITITITYGGDQRQRLVDLADGTAHKIGRNYSQTPNLLLAAQETIPNLTAQNGSEEFLQLVYDLGTPATPTTRAVASKLIYPRLTNGQRIPP